MDFGIRNPVALGVLLVVLITLGRFILSHIKNPLNVIPGPRLAIWTNLPLKWAVITGRRMYYVHDLHLKYGPFVRIAPREISVSDPGAFMQIHKIGAGFNKSQWYTDLTAFERPTVFTMSEPKAHGARRKLLARAFSKSYLREFWEPVVHEKIKLVVNQITEEIQRKGFADLLKWWTFMATDVSSELMFGDCFHMIERGEKNRYIRVLEKALQAGGIGAELPLFRALGKNLPFQASKDMFDSNSFLLGYAEVAVTNAKAGGQKNLFAHITHEAGKDERLDDLDLKLEALGLIVAGSDTTAVTLTYLVWAVLLHTKLKEDLSREVGELSNDYSDRDLEELPVLNALIEETLRLYGAAPGGTPRVAPPTGARLGEYFVPPGTIVTTQSYTMHRDPKIFPRPYEFDHTRWLSKPGSQEADLIQSPNSEILKGVFTPFGAGSRTCIGIHLARMELRLATAEFFRRCPDAKIVPSTTPESMEMENFFLITPKSHKCEISL